MYEYSNIEMSAISRQQADCTGQLYVLARHQEFGSQIPIFFRNLSTRRLRVDDLWGFNYGSMKNVTPKIAAEVAGAGDVWRWVAIDADTKLVPAWLLGARDAGCAEVFIRNLASRLKHRAQLTSDGHRRYLEAVESAFGADVDDAMLVSCTERTPRTARSAAGRRRASGWRPPKSLTRHVGASE
jgi:hypothetical protein